MIKSRSVSTTILSECSCPLIFFAFGEFLSDFFLSVFLEMKVWVMCIICVYLLDIDRIGRVIRGMPALVAMTSVFIASHWLILDLSYVATCTWVLFHFTSQTILKISKLCTHSLRKGSRRSLHNPYTFSYPSSFHPHFSHSLSDEITEFETIL